MRPLRRAVAVKRTPVHWFESIVVELNNSKTSGPTMTDRREARLEHTRHACWHLPCWDYVSHFHAALLFDLCHIGAFLSTVRMFTVAGLPLDGATNGTSLNSLLNRWLLETVVQRNTYFVVFIIKFNSGSSTHIKVHNKLRGRPPQYAPAPCKLTFDLLTLKVVSESRTTWATSVGILVFLGLSILDLDAMYATDRRQTRIIA